MSRVHLVELHDLRVCPRSLRDALTDFLAFALRLGGTYDGVGPLLRAAVRRAGASRVVDLCSGAGGPWPRLASEVGVPVVLTDLYPNRAAQAGPIPFHPDPVDARAVPASLDGFRTLFTSFHHFRPAEARAILADAVRRRQGIAVFEAVRRDVRDMALVALTGLGTLAATPFVRPFRWSRLVWTYLPPILPLLGTFDALVSCLRAYAPAELGKLVRGLDAYEWEIGKLRGKWLPLRATYLIGVPGRRSVSTRG
ncbi:MAG: class I SAM-dependent methyltransferase [Gemmatimonadales bacterium]